MPTSTGSPRFHLFLPQMRMTHDAIVERARTAEAVGFEGMAFMDHVVPPLAPETTGVDTVTAGSHAPAYRAMTLAPVGETIGKNVER